MITHHPKEQLLQLFAQGELPASLSIAIAAHNEYCPHCQKLTEQFTQSASQQVFETTDATGDYQLEHDLLSMMDDIVSDEEQSVLVPAAAQQIALSYKTVTLPRALTNTPLKKWSKMGDVSRSRLDLNEEPMRSSLLDIAPGATVPMHTHKGFELTLILDGSFEDDMGTYQRGDFIWLDGQHTHSPVTKDGCLCYTVSDDALKFTQGLSKLLNPIGSFLY